MKVITTLFLTFLVTVSFANDPKEAKPTKQLANTLLEVYQSYQKNDLDKVRTLMESMAFEQTKSVVHKPSRFTTADSLIFKNNELSRWGYYRSVDLEYLRNVEVLIVLKHDEPSMLFNQLVDVLRSSCQAITTESNRREDFHEMIFTDIIGAEILDDRFVENTSTYWESLYEYKVTQMGDFITLEFKETIPKKLVAQSTLAKEQHRQLDQD